jgi:hypothetical protein
MGILHVRSARIGFAAATLLVSIGAGRAAATLQTERAELRAGISTQSTFHHRSVDEIEWVQQRNEFRAELKYDLIARGERFSLLRVARLNLLYRARYDAVFDVRDSYRARGYDRDDFRFPEGKYPRELFLDLDFVGPLEGLSARIGRQQVVWGEADLFRSLDVVNPLRLDQNGLVGEDFSDYREPLWIAKFLIDIGTLGPVNGAGLEFFYSPNGRPLNDRIIIGEAYRIGLDENNALTGFRRKNSSPFDRVRHPWEVQRVGPYPTEAPDYADLGADPSTCNDGLGCADFIYLTEEQTPTSTLDWEASMAGVRLLGQTFAGINFSLNYIYRRAELPGTELHVGALFDPALATDGSFNSRADLVAQAVAGEATLDLDGDGVPDGRADLIRRCVFDHEAVYVASSIHGTGNLLSGCLPVTFWHPWTHVVGVTGTYNDFDWTGFIFRVEQSFTTKEPRNGAPPLAGPRAGEFPTERDFTTNIRRTTGVWRSMVGFDSLRALAPGAGRTMPQPFRSLLMDQWFLSFQFFNEYYTHVNGQMGLLDSPSDRMQHWNPIFTAVATGYFVQQRLRPWIAAAYDVNAEFPILWVQGTYALSRRLELRVGEVLYLGSRRSESFLFLHKYADRDTFFVRLAYWFL